MKMKIKIMYPNSRGKIELTKAELEKLLNESYSEGYCDGINRYQCSTSIQSPIPSQPYITYCNSSSNDGWCTNKAAISDVLDNTVSYATSMSEDMTQAVNRYTVDETKTIEICNINGIGVVKTNED